MSKHLDGSGAQIAAVHHSLCRRIRIANERIRLAQGIEVVAESRPDVFSAVPKGLEDMLSYRQLADYGLAHATFRHAAGSLIVLAAANRVWRRPELRRRLIAVKRDARRLGRRVVLVTKRGLFRMVDQGLARKA